MTPTNYTCADCGTHIRDDWQFCPLCGRFIRRLYKSIECTKGDYMTVQVLRPVDPLEWRTL